jgi:moderate conductance mechanosensitive channel
VVIDVPVPATVDVNRVSDILQLVGTDAFEDTELHPLLLDAPSVMGVESIEVDQFKSVWSRELSPASSSR